MRELKFRAQQLDNKEWVYGFYAKIHGDHYILIDGSSNLVIVDRKTVGQYTGLKDKNGTEIYESDLITIKSATANELDFYGEVVFVNGTFCLKSEHQPKDWSYTECVRFWNDGSHDHHSLEIIESFEMEVIGNIHTKEY